MERYNKPVLYDECVYEGNVKQSWGSLSGPEMMNRFWKVMTHGGYCTHGEVYLDSQLENLDEAVLWWGKGGKLIGTSPKRIAYLRALMEEINEPLTPYVTGFAAMLKFAEENEGFRMSLPAPLRKLIENKKNMDPVELALQEAQEVPFAGHTKDDKYILFYYGTDCFGRVDVEVPEGSYKVEVIDAWNMTRETVMKHMSGSFEVKLPGREYMAVLCTRE